LQPSSGEAKEMEGDCDAIIDSRLSCIANCNTPIIVNEGGVLIAVSLEWSLNARIEAVRYCWGKLGDLVLLGKIMMGISIIVCHRTKMDIF
jgi:hypothetical protein